MNEVRKRAFFGLAGLSFVLTALLVEHAPVSNEVKMAVIKMSFYVGGFLIGYSNVYKDDKA